MKRPFFCLLICSPLLTTACSSSQKDPTGSDSSDEDSSDEKSDSKPGDGDEADSKSKEDSSGPSTTGEDMGSTGSAGMDTKSTSSEGSESSMSAEESGDGSDEESSGSESSEGESGESTDDGSPKEGEFLLEVTVDESKNAGGQLPKGKLRFAVDIQSTDESDLKGVKRNLVDRGVKPKEGKFKISIPRPDASKDLGDQSSIVLPAILYVDNDDNKSFGPDDTTIGTFRNYLVYHGPDSDQAEWAVADAKSGKTSKLGKSLPLYRLDGLEEAKDFVVGGDVKALADDFHTAVLVTSKEFLDLKKEFIRIPMRNFEYLIPRDAEKWQSAIVDELDGRMIDSFIPGFGEHGLTWMAGYRNSVGNEMFTLGRLSKIIRNLCFEKSAVVALWFSPDKWIQSSEGARRAAVLGIRPGWNLGAATREGTSINIEYLSADDGKKLSANDACKVEPNAVPAP